LAGDATGQDKLASLELAIKEREFDNVDCRYSWNYLLEVVKASVLKRSALLWFLRVMNEFLRNEGL
jgi:hydroxymethylpyrimidine pyrophosphatase-like HAD family hydrolase